MAAHKGSKVYTLCPHLRGRCPQRLPSIAFLIDFLQSYNLSVLQSYHLAVMQSYNLAVIQSYNTTSSRSLVSLTHVIEKLVFIEALDVQWLCSFFTSELMIISLSVNDTLLTPLLFLLFIFYIYVCCCCLQFGQQIILQNCKIARLNVTWFLWGIQASDREGGRTSYAMTATISPSPQAKMRTLRKMELSRNMLGPSRHP